MLGIAARLLICVLWKYHQCYSHLTQVHISYRSWCCCCCDEYSYPVASAGLGGSDVQNCIVQTPYGKNGVT